MLKKKLLIAYDIVGVCTLGAALISQLRHDLQYGIYFILITILVRMLRKDCADKLEKEKTVEIVLPFKNMEDFNVKDKNNR